MGLWSTLKSTVMAVAAMLNVTTDNVCFDGIGCFSNVEPFNNAAGKLPQSPAHIGTVFLLYTRSNSLVPQVISNDPLLINASNFNGNLKTKFIIHGYRDDGREDWLVHMKDELLKLGDMNVILVDWEMGAGEKDYNQAAANTRVVGAIVTQLIEALNLYKGAIPSDMHIIGHSLGAHTAGYAGKGVRLGRISGLDPAGLSFSGKSSQVRLDPSDALFVDVIHTDGQHILTLGFGSIKPMGHVDFYPNGGKNQPGCKAAGLHLFKLITGKFKSFTKGIACDHARARDLYIESIGSTTCAFTSVPCDNVDDYENGVCACNGMCALMGYYADVGNPRGKHFLSTYGDAPFCMSQIL